MAFTTACFIRKNTKELQNNLSDIGYHICYCCRNKDSIWLNNLIDDGTIHGIGYDYNNPSINTPKDMTEFFLFENKEYGNKSIDCGENEELFLAIAALRDDSDINQYFVLDTTVCWASENCKPKGTFILCKKDKWNVDFDINGNPSVFSSRNIPAHKATVKELIEHFK